jgi:hypothetical protein
MCIYNNNNNNNNNFKNVKNMGIAGVFWKDGPYVIVRCSQWSQAAAYDVSLEDAGI